MSNGSWRVYRRPFAGNGEQIAIVDSVYAANSKMIERARHDASALRKLFPGRDVRVETTDEGSLPYSARQMRITVGSSGTAMAYWAYGD